MAEEVKSEDASLSAEDAPVSIEEQPSTSAQEPAAPSLLLRQHTFPVLTPRLGSVGLGPPS